MRRRRIFAALAGLIALLATVTVGQDSASADPITQLSAYGASLSTLGIKYGPTPTVSGTDTQSQTETSLAASTLFTAEDRQVPDLRAHAGFPKHAEHDGRLSSPTRSRSCLTCCDRTWR
jgi:hypothetical protein